MKKTQNHKKAGHFRPEVNQIFASALLTALAEVMWSQPSSQNNPMSLCVQAQGALLQRCFQAGREIPQSLREGIQEPCGVCWEHPLPSSTVCTKPSALHSSINMSPNAAL